MSDRRPRVVFFALRELHMPVLLPVYREVVKAGEVECGFMAPPHRRSEDGGVQEGLSLDWVTTLEREGIPFWGERPSEPASCVVVADACYDRVDGWGPVVCIGHGTISKGFYFNNRPAVRRENFARVLCVPGPWYASSFGSEVFTTIVPTGFSKMDELAGDGAAATADIRCRYGLDSSRRTILFAPTFNPELTSLEILEPLWPEIDASRDQVLFKLHGATDESWKRRYRELAQRLPHLHYIEDTSLAPAMLAADVIVSDVSSAYLEAFVTGKPVVVINNPAMEQYAGFNIGDIEYVARDGAYQAASAVECQQILERVRHEDPLGAVRARYADMLFAARDGRNSARIAGQVLLVAMGGVPHRLPRPADRMSVFIPDAANLQCLEANIARAWSNIALYTRSAGPAIVSGRSVTTLRDGQIPPRPFICLTGEHALPDGWDVLWFMASHFNPRAEGVFGPMLQDDDNRHPQSHTRLFPNGPRRSDTGAQAAFKHQVFDQLAAAPALEADGTIVSRRVPHDLAAHWLKSVGSRTGRANVATKMRARGLAVGVLPGLLALAPSRKAPAASVCASPSAARSQQSMLFYCQKNVHLSIFAPVIAAVRAIDPGVVMSFTSPPREVAAREGLSDAERDGFAATTGATWIPDHHASKPTVVVTADCVADRLRHHRRIVNLGHGLISKGQYFGASSLIGRENLADAICVPGPWHAEQLRRHLYIPIHVTGMSKLDTLFAPFDECAFRASSGLPAADPIVLWCPTFNAELSSIPVIGRDIARLTTLGHVVIKVHGATDPAVRDHVRASVAGRDDITWVDPSSDATPFMRCASVLVTDVSSVMFEFAALDRPVVLVDNPRRQEYRYYDASNVEYAMRDIGTRVSSVEALVEAARDALADPARHQAHRQRATRAMFASTDGRSAERIAHVLLERPCRAPWMGPYDAVLPAHFTPADAAFCAPGLGAAANVIGPSALTSAVGHPRYRRYDTRDELESQINASQSETAIVFRRPARLVGDWRAPLLGPLYLNGGGDRPRLTAPLSTSVADVATHVGRFLKRDRLNLPAAPGVDLLAGVIRLTNPGEWTHATSIDSPVVAMRRDGMIGEMRAWNEDERPAGLVVADALAAEREWTSSEVRVD